MSFTYSGYPGTSQNDAVRFELGDTLEKTQLVQDEEIQYALEKEGTVYRAAARCAESLAARFAREENVRTSTYTALKGQLQSHYENLAKRLRRRGATSGGFLCPSMSLSHKRVNANDPDLGMVISYKGIHSNTGAQLPTKVDVD